MRHIKGELAGAVILLEDVTHLRELDRLKSEFIAGASHELRTPLTSLEMGVHLLLEGSMGDLAPKQHELLVMCREDALRLDRLVKELLDLSKIESGEAALHLVELSPHDLLVEAVAPLRRQADAKGLHLHVDAPADLPDVAADRGQVERVIANLVTNAIRATEVPRQSRLVRDCAAVSSRSRFAILAAGFPPNTSIESSSRSSRSQMRRPAPSDWAWRFRAGSCRHMVVSWRYDRRWDRAPRSHSPSLSRSGLAV